MSIPTLHKDFFDFLALHSHDDTHRLRLKAKELTQRYPAVPVDFALMQMECRKKYTAKFPVFLSNGATLFPTSLSAEQATAEPVARLHASLYGGNTLVDMTAGLGIDVMNMASGFAHALAFDLDPLKAAILRHNLKALGIDNIEVHSGDSVKWFENEQHTDKYSVVFSDPARRDASNQRVYGLSDCMPDMTLNAGKILDFTERLVIKASPMLDISRTVSELPSVKSIRCISLEGECKEILVECRQGDSALVVEAIDIDKNGEVNYTFSTSGIQEAEPVPMATYETLTEGNWLYEPGAAVMKTSPWGALARKFPGIRKLAHDSHLFVAERHFKDFPGRVLKITSMPSHKELKALKGQHLNIVSRNHPDSPETIRRRLGIKEGKDDFLYASRLGSKPVFICARRMKKDSPQ